MSKGEHTRVVVIGSGVGGLAASAMLARKGFDITVLERQMYPGGCAATFMQKGYRFDAGATVGCGFQKKGPLDLLGRELGISWPVMTCPAAWQYVSGGRNITLSAARQEIIDRFPATGPFWEEQERLATTLWQLAGNGLPWPPVGLRDYGNLLRRAAGRHAALFPFLRLMNRSALQWLAAHGLHKDRDFVRFIDAQLLISVQTTAEHACAVNAAIALDLPVKGTHRLTGGIGRVAEELAGSIMKSGGAVRYGQGVKRLEREGRRVVSVTTDDGHSIPADIVIANLTPESLNGLFEKKLFSERSLQRRCAPVWSAFTLYLGVRESAFSGTVDHVQIVTPHGDLGEGNSIFVSVSPSDDSLRAPEGFRTVTVSTHTRPEPWFAACERGKEDYRQLKDLYTQKVLALLCGHFGALERNVSLLSAGTPVTWERYTGRRYGYVGGYPQTSLFRVRGPLTPCKNLFLAGDSIFPGQSLPGVVTGARRVVDLVERQSAKM